VKLEVEDAVITRLLNVVETSGLGDWLEHELTGGRDRGVGTKVGGMVRELSARTLLVGLLTLAWAEQPLILRDLVALLNNLKPASKRRLGLDATVTERQVSYLFGRITAILDPSPHAAYNRQRYEALRDGVITQHLLAAAGIDVDAHDVRERIANGEAVDIQLDAAAQAGLNEAIKDVKAEHQVWLDAKHAKLRWVLDRGLDATLPADVTHTGSYGVDGSQVRTWARQNRRQPKAPWLYPDPDAAWNAKKSWGQQGRTNGWYGYELHGVVRLGEVGGGDTPCLTERIELTPASADPREVALGVFTRMVADHETLDTNNGVSPRPRRDVIADRAYTSETKKATDWIWPLWELGFTSVHDLTVHQLGEGNRRSRRPANGAIVIDGQPYSPRLPQHLRNLARPEPGTSRDELEDYQALIAQRKVYALHAVGGRNDDGSWDFGCRAMAVLGQLRCELKPASLDRPLFRPTTSPEVYTPAGGRLPKVCGQQKSRIQREELPFWQPDLYGSAEWAQSYARRNRVEGYFGNIKNDAAQDITRGNIRVMGLAKTSLLTLMNVMVTNLRLLDLWRARQMRRDELRAAGRPEDDGITPVKRKPRRRTRLLAETRARIAAAKVASGALAAHQPVPVDTSPNRELAGAAPALE
jgi:hypothetical protein